MVGEEQADPNKPLDLSYNESALTFEFAALSYAAPERNRYQYKLEGFDSSWIETNRNIANYTNLEPGDYRFLVRAANRHGVWNDEPVALSIEIEPPPWRSWWAYASYVVLLGLAGFALWRYQKQRLERVRTEQRLESAEKDLALTAAVQNGFLPEQPRYEEGFLRLQGFWRSATACVAATGGRTSEGPRGGSWCSSVTSRAMARALRW